MSQLTTLYEGDLKDIAEGKGILCAIDATGDSRHMWDPSRPDEVAAMKKLFTEQRAKGMTAYHVKKNGEPGKIITEFPDEEGKVIFAPALRGG